MKVVKLAMYNGFLMVLLGAVFSKVFAAMFIFPLIIACRLIEVAGVVVWYNGAKLWCTGRRVPVKLAWFITLPLLLIMMMLS